MINSLSEIVNTILKSNKFLIFPHVNMDADSLGSSTALCLALRKLGKEAYVCIDDKIPDNLDFLDCRCVTCNQEIFDSVDICIQIDSCGLKRIEGREQAWNKGNKKICIDHHPFIEEEISNYMLYRTEPKTAASGEIIYKLINLMNVEIGLDIANCIFAAITTDTGNFQHSNTTSETHMIMSEIHRIQGFDAKAISALIYDRKTPESIMLQSKVLENLKFYYDGQIVIGDVSIDLLQECGCRLEDAEGLVQRLMSIKNVEAGCLIKEYDDKFRASLRGKFYANVASVAENFGGGGHKKAAGCTFNKSEYPDGIDEIYKKISLELSKII